MTSLGKETIWIVDYDGGYTVDEQATITSGKWSAFDGPLGDSTDKLPFSLTMKAILATPGCADRLAKIQSTDSDYVAALPAGCVPFGTVTVNVSKP